MRSAYHPVSTDSLNAARSSPCKPPARRRPRPPADASSFRGSEEEGKALRMAGGGFFGGNVHYCDAAGDMRCGRVQLPPNRPQNFLRTRQAARRFHSHRGARETCPQDRTLQPRVLRPHRAARQARCQIPGPRRAGRDQPRRRDVRVVSYGQGSRVDESRTELHIATLAFDDCTSPR